MGACLLAAVGLASCEEQTVNLFRPPDEEGIGGVTADIELTSGGYNPVGVGLLPQGGTTPTAMPPQAGFQVGQLTAVGGFPEIPVPKDTFGIGGRTYEPCDRPYKYVDSTGRCISCRDDKPDKPFVHPSLAMCVECLEDRDCDKRFQTAPGLYVCDYWCRMTCTNVGQPDLSSAGAAGSEPVSQVLTQSDCPYPLFCAPLESISTQQTVCVQCRDERDCADCSFGFCPRPPANSQTN